MGIVSYPYIRQLKFGVAENGYVTLNDITFRNVTVPKGFLFDGVTVKAPFTMLFSQKNLRNGIRASCIHDYMCQNKHIHSRQEATKALCQTWVEDGLGEIKACVVFALVEAFQFLKGWR